MQYIKKRSFGLWVSLVAIMLMAGIQACTENPTLGGTFLEAPPSVKSTQDSIFSHADLAERFLNNAYRSLPYGPGAVNGPFDTDQLNGDPLAAITDINYSADFNGGASVLYYSGSYSSTAEENQSNYTKYNYFNSGAWAGIRQAHIFIDNIDKVPDMDAATKKKLKAEARMIIAVHYTELFRNYGGVPWVTHAYSPNEDLNLPRSTAKATLDSTLAVINKAIPDLPFAVASLESDAGRFTQAAAMGLKVRLLLFAASPLFNADQPFMQGKAADEKLVWYGGYNPALWQQTADAAKELINKVEQTGAYHLVDTGNPQQDFEHAYFDRNSPEILISTRKRYKAGGFPPHSSNHGQFCTTDNYVKMFPMADGTPIDDPDSGYDPSHPFDNRDPRLYKTVLLTGEPYQGRTAEVWIGGRERKTKNARPAFTGYQARKFLMDIQTARNAPVQFPYLRLSGIYLDYAEALNEANGGPTTEAYKYINKVRNRVDLDDLPAGMSQDEFRQAVMHERALELGYEQNRWYDMIRRKRKDLFTKTLYGMNTCKKGVSPSGACTDNGYGYHESDQFIYARFKIQVRAWATDFSPKWYLSAFPRNEILKTKMVQNPGW